MISEQQVELPISGMHCANCAGAVERALLKSPGVLKADVSYATERARVECCTDARQALAALERSRAPEAAALIERLSGGYPQAPLTREARSALGRVSAN